MAEIVGLDETQACISPRSSLPPMPLPQLPPWAPQGCGLDGLKKYEEGGETAAGALSSRTAAGKLPAPLCCEADLGVQELWAELAHQRRLHEVTLASLDGLRAQCSLLASEVASLTARVNKAENLAMQCDEVRHEPQVVSAEEPQTVCGCPATTVEDLVASGSKARPQESDLPALLSGRVTTPSQARSQDEEKRWATAKTTSLGRSWPTKAPTPRIFVAPPPVVMASPGISRSYQLSAGSSSTPVGGAAAPFTPRQPLSLGHRLCSSVQQPQRGPVVWATATSRSQAASQQLIQPAPVFVAAQARAVKRAPAVAEAPAGGMFPGAMSRSTFFLSY